MAAEKNMQQPRQRIFSNEFSVGDTVAIIRHRHGWEDGKVCGEVVKLTDFSMKVKSVNGSVYEIEHPRDARKC